MRWTNLFSHLEDDFALDAHRPRDSSHRDSESDSHLLEACVRAKAAGERVTVGVATGDVFHVVPRAVSTGWFSGLVGGESGLGVVIPLGAIAWVEFPTGRASSGNTATVSATLSDVLRDIARRRAVVTVRTMHSDVVGVIASVGNGFFDVAGHNTTPLATTRRFPLTSIVAVLQGSATWG
jgi:hypothetical protein